MDQAVFYGIFIPFLGTSLGAACVFFMKHDMSERLSRILTGFAAGVMVAASIWSLLIPAVDQSEEMGKFALYLLIDRLGGGHKGIVWTELEGKLMIRESCTLVEYANRMEYYICQKTGHEPVFLCYLKLYV